MRKRLQLQKQQKRGEDHEWSQIVYENHRHQRQSGERDTETNHECAPTSWSKEVNDLAGDIASIERQNGDQIYDPNDGPSPPDSERRIVGGVLIVG